MLTRLYFWALASVTPWCLLGYYIEGARCWGRVGRDWDLAFGVANLPAERLPSIGGVHCSAYAISCIFWIIAWTVILLIVHLAPHRSSRATETPAQRPAPARGQTS